MSPQTVVFLSVIQRLRSTVSATDSLFAFVYLNVYVFYIYMCIYTYIQPYYNTIILMYSSYSLLLFIRVVFLVFICYGRERTSREPQMRLES